jgi:uncharacterized protein (DUF1499 family)
MCSDYYIAQRALTVQQHREGPKLAFDFVPCGQLHWPNCVISIKMPNKHHIQAVPFKQWQNMSYVFLEKCAMEVDAD